MLWTPTMVLKRGCGVRRKKKQDIRKKNMREDTQEMTQSRSKAFPKT